MGLNVYSLVAIMLIIHRNAVDAATVNTTALDLVLSD